VYGRRFESTDGNVRPLAPPPRFGEGAGGEVLAWACENLSPLPEAGRGEPNPAGGR